LKNDELLRILSQCEKKIAGLQKMHTAYSLNANLGDANQVKEELIEVLREFWSSKVQLNKSLAEENMIKLAIGGPCDFMHEEMAPGDVLAF
jgi:hypothetical protein